MKTLISILLMMTTLQLAQAKEHAVLEMVLYKIKKEHATQYERLLDQVRDMLQEMPGFLDYTTYQSAEHELIFMDVVRWNSLEDAREAASQVEKNEAFKPFLAAFEEIKFMDHFNPYNAMNKLDLKKSDSTYYKASAKPQLIELGPLNYLSINGVSAPEDDLFTNALEAIYAVAYTVKFAQKAEGRDYVVAPMEGQWWVESDKPFAETPREEWHWNILIRLPEFVNKSEVEQAVQEVIAKKKLARTSEVRFTTLNEGKVVQILHLGSYEDEAENIEKIHEFIYSNGMEINGHHHEIYLNDPSKTPVEKLRTIIRYPAK